jgi:putative ABC transport system substrate-binding protein
MNRREWIALVGGAAAWPFAARAQQPLKIHRIAVVHPSATVSDMSETGDNPGYRAFFQELSRLGYVEKKNLLVDRYSGEGRVERYAELAGKVVQLNPNAIFAVSSRMVQNFKAATSVIPVVGLMADPLRFQLVASLSRPGGNVTGVTSDVGFDIGTKRLELLKEAIPGISRVGVLISKELVEGRVGALLVESAHQVGVSLVGPPLATPIQEQEYRRVFKAMSEEHADALVINDQGEHFPNRGIIAKLAEEYRFPIMGVHRGYVEAGVLMAYGVNYPSLFRIAATQLDQVLKGTKPSDIPIQQPTRMELVINVKAASALGITIPPTFLARADELIE